MDQCCTDKADVLDKLRERQAGTLRIVLILNAVMFAVEMVSGIMAGSLALVADSLDMLGDALVYGFSLYAVGRALIWKVRAALSKAAIMALFGAFVLCELVYKLVFHPLPAYETMGLVGALALLVNTTCFFILWKHRAEDINMRSVWLCSNNDLVANVCVLLASWAVKRFQSPWPDIVVGGIICAIFLRSAIVVTIEARDQLRETRA